MTRCLGTPTRRCGRLIPSGSRCPDCAASYRGDRNQKTSFRNAVLARDRFTCVRCGLYDPSGRGLEADHVVPLAEGGAALDVGNGVSLCRACHGEKTRKAARR
jgi:5-methylcytosine-specific restriction endonuclease McrA